VIAMKSLPRLLLVSLAALLVLLPLAASADQIEYHRPAEHSLQPGTHTIAYGGELLRFTTSVTLSVRFENPAPNRIKLIVRTRGTGGSGYGPEGTNLEIHWEDWDVTVYDGEAPPTSSGWEGILHTESGFTEK